MLLHGVDDAKHDERRAEGPGDIHARANELGEELLRVAVQQAGHSLPGLAEIVAGSDAVPAGAIRAIGKQAKAEDSPRSAEPVDRDGSARVIDLEDAFVGRGRRHRR